MNNTLEVIGTEKLYTESEKYLFPLLVRDFLQDFFLSLCFYFLSKSSYPLKAVAINISRAVAPLHLLSGAPLHKEKVRGEKV